MNELCLLYLQSGTNRAFNDSVQLCVVGVHLLWGAEVKCAAMLE